LARRRTRALADAATCLGRLGVNLVGSSTSSIESSGLAEWGFFAEINDQSISIDRVNDALREVPHVIRSDFGFLVKEDA
jgi:hypothetical protein